MTIQIVTDGGAYEGWTDVNVTRSIDDLAGTFDISSCIDRSESNFSSDPDLQEDIEASILIFGQKVITGFIDKRVGTMGPDDYTLQLSGRSKTRNCIDCSSIHETGQFNNKKTSEIVSDISKMLNVNVINQIPSDPVHPRFIFRDGEFAERTIRTCCREFGITATDDAEGNLVLKEIGLRQGQDALVLGVNIHRYTVTKDVSERHSDYLTKGQSVPTDDNYGKPATEIVRHVKDTGLKSFRPLIVHMDGDADNNKVQNRAEMEAARRLGEGLTVSITVAGWVQESGTIWEPDMLHYVDIPTEGIAETLLLKSVSFTLSNSTYETSLEFTPPESYQSQTTSPKSGGKKAKTGTKSPSNQINSGGNTAAGLKRGEIIGVNFNDIGTLNDPRFSGVSP